MQSRQSVWVAILGFTVVQHGHAAETPAVTVNGVVITNTDVDNAFKRTRAARQPLTAEQTERYRQHVLRILVDELLIGQFLDEYKIDVDPKKVDEHIEKFKEQLARQNRTVEDFLAEMSIDVATMRRDIRNLQRWLAYVDGQASEKALHSYFEANKAAFDGSQVRASHILVKATAEQNAAERQKARSTAQALLAQLASGAAFADVAKKHSDCPSRDEGGDLGFFPRKGVMIEPFAVAAFGLKVGQTSEIVETEFGYHIILVTDQKPGRPIAYEDVADDVKNSYAEDLRGATVTRMRQKAKIEQPVQSLRPKQEPAKGAN
jgi:parvulin-like peptidyl-prolyl isomerase